MVLGARIGPGGTTAGFGSGRDSGSCTRCVAASLGSQVGASSSVGGRASGLAASATGGWAGGGMVMLGSELVRARVPGTIGASSTGGARSRATCEKPRTSGVTFGSGSRGNGASLADKREGSTAWVQAVDCTNSDRNSSRASAAEEMRRVGSGSTKRSRTCRRSGGNRSSSAAMTFSDCPNRQRSPVRRGSRAAFSSGARRAGIMSSANQSEGRWMGMPAKVAVPSGRVRISCSQRSGSRRPRSCRVFIRVNSDRATFTRFSAAPTKVRAWPKRWASPGKGRAQYKIFEPSAYSSAPWSKAALSGSLAKCSVAVRIINT